MRFAGPFGVLRLLLEAFPDSSSRSYSSRVAESLGQRNWILGSPGPALALPPCGCSNRNNYTSVSCQLSVFRASVYFFLDQMVSHINFKYFSGCGHLSAGTGEQLAVLGLAQVGRSLSSYRRQTNKQKAPCLLAFSSLWEIISDFLSQSRKKYPSDFLLILICI